MTCARLSLDVHRSAFSLKSFLFSFSFPPSPFSFSTTLFIHRELYTSINPPPIVVTKVNSQVSAPRTAPWAVSFQWFSGQ
jgi:hypothetical protein